MFYQRAIPIYVQFRPSFFCSKIWVFFSSAVTESDAKNFSLFAVTCNFLAIETSLSVVEFNNTYA